MKNVALKRASFLGLAFAGIKSFGQNIKNLDMKDLSENIKESGSSIMDIIETITIIGLAIALMVVVYMVATKNQHSREWVIGFVAGVIIYLVFFQLLSF